MELESVETEKRDLSEKLRSATERLEYSKSWRNNLLSKTEGMIRGHNDLKHLHHQLQAQLLGAQNELKIALAKGATMKQAIKQVQEENFKSKIDKVDLSAKIQSVKKDLTKMRTANILNRSLRRIYKHRYDREAQNVQLVKHEASRRLIEFERQKREELSNQKSQMETEVFKQRDFLGQLNRQNQEQMNYIQSHRLVDASCFKASKENTLAENFDSNEKEMNLEGNVHLKTWLGGLFAFGFRLPSCWTKALIHI